MTPILPVQPDIAPICQRIAALLRSLAAEIEDFVACVAPSSAEAAVPDVAARAAKPVFAAGGKKYTSARIEVIREHYPMGVAAKDILPLINALPGPAFTLNQIASAANAAGIKRPPGFKALAAGRWRAAKRAGGAAAPDNADCLAVSRRTPARDAVLRQHYPAGTPAAEILPLLNALPGIPIQQSDVSRLAYEIGLSRPQGFSGTRTAARVAEQPRRLPPAPPPAACATPAPVRKMPLPAKGAPPKLAAYQPPKSAATPAPRLPTPAERRRAAESAAIAAHIAQKGVVVCPPAVAAATTHVPTPADAAAIRAVVDAAENARRAQIEESQRRIARNRAMRLAGKKPAARAHA